MGYIISPISYGAISYGLYRYHMLRERLNRRRVHESLLKNASKSANGTKMVITKLLSRHLFKKQHSGRISMDQTLRHLVAWALFNSGKLSDVNLKFILLQQDSCLNWFASASILTNQNSTIYLKIMHRPSDLFIIHLDTTSFLKVNWTLGCTQTPSFRFRLVRNDNELIDCFRV